MVVFTCSHCGDSLKKNTVEKHYNTKCRGGRIFITCIDCLKDFNENYVDHTKCITELERYSGKDYVANPGQNKGERKQKQWVDLVHDIIQNKSATLDSNIRAILNKCLNFDNVPRKQAKFKNFLSNSLRVRPDQAEIVWKLLDEEIQRESKKTQNEQENLHMEPPSKKVKLDNSINTEVETNGKDIKTESNGHDNTENGNNAVETKFEWEETILKFLRKKSQISQEKLSKKVLNKYLKYLNENEITEKMTKKFQKKLKKISNVSIVDGNVVLVSADE